MLGIENLVKNKKSLQYLKTKKIGLVAHPASVDRNLHHSLDILITDYKLPVVAAFGPQHGMRGEKQDNMIESENYIDPIYKIPVYSLYGEVRRPTEKMLKNLDIILFDLQDVGCRIYTFLTTLFYVLEEAHRLKKEVWVLDRPNPAGRPIEGNYLKKEYFSFVGAAEIPMRHGLTLGEAGLWYIDKMNLDVEYKVIKMSGYNPHKKQDWGWPEKKLSWVNPSPNIPQISTARIYPGTVLIEGTKLSEGRGSTRPLELVAHPKIKGELITARTLNMTKKYLGGATLRPMFFEPTFQKHKGQLCSGFQIHVDQKKYDHNNFKPYRIVCAAFKAVRQEYPDFDLWLPPPYEYEKINMPIDILSGDSTLRTWVDDKTATMGDFDKFLTADEKKWAKERKKFLLY
jgi:uncharacterized protein YbbC (DUF1343 family)